MNDTFFSDAELAKLRKISMEEIGELIGNVKLKCGGIVAGSEEWLEALNRTFHTITGSAGDAGLAEISELAAEAESLAAPEAGRPDESAINRIRENMDRIENLLNG